MSQSELEYEILVITETPMRPKDMVLQLQKITSRIISSSPTDSSRQASSESRDYEISSVEALR